MSLTRFSFTNIKDYRKFKADQRAQAQGKVDPATGTGTKADPVATPEVVGALKAETTKKRKSGCKGCGKSRSK